MSKYSYRARTASGQLVRGTLRAATQDRAVSLLRSHSLTPVELWGALDVTKQARRKSSREKSRDKQLTGVGTARPHRIEIKNELGTSPHPGHA